MEKILEVKSLAKYFGGLSAVNDLYFSIDKGQIIGIIGPNGAGKTTLFNLLTGFLRPNGGEILFKGINIVGKKPHDIVNLGIARTFQVVRPFHQLTVLNNVLVPSLSKKILEKGKSKRHDESKAVDILDSVGLGEKTGFMAKDLSHGDLRRLELARALATEPDLLLLDEPFSGLAKIETDILLPLIERLNKGGLTIILIEHKLRELMRLVERVITLDFGVKIAEGTPQEIARDEAVIKAYLGKGGKRFVTS
ncbi:MAG: ABC transporter ATP-binding protein [Pseudomonadota bacterium]